MDKENLQYQEGCLYNDGVVCFRHDSCEHCGWNPEVAKARLEAQKGGT